jgi:hypothetical protein
VARHLSFHSMHRSLHNCSQRQPLQLLPISYHSNGQAPSYHSEPNGWGPLRLCLFIICICTRVDSDSHHSSCRSHYNTLFLLRRPCSNTVKSQA